ncbi:hypothetical protein GSI_01498 [Ganoderma sinense ZZ0214-1]|uniref:Uncharacterized protein n=1 Tax=Ganoderma sinense ZZ0214-1 TaxID=1077348 RepID=A0A2G8SQI7_9APHY|nr:hypothetical protein GSI_01498 [Ganoderma sinense ZZ0214-1]
MFSRGSRFPSAKGSDVPGPGAYNAQDPEYDAYKRGAFLEKTNRFNKDKPDDVPGPGAYDADGAGGQNRPPTRTGNHTTTDRLAVLQRKLEDLERIHVEEKKAHHLEQERLRLELSRAQRTAAEQTERADKLKKQTDALDARVQELKKAAANDQGELRELRLKLRASEHERTQLAAKQGDAAEARKAEARRRDELRERDRKVAELEKALGVEKKKQEAAEAQLAEAKGKTDERVQEAQAAAEDATSQLREAQKEAQAARDALQQIESRAENAEEDLVAQLEQHRYALSRVAQEYGKLASTTIALSTHRLVKQEVVALQLRNNKLERKLANSDGQVVELANLIRQVKEENVFLVSQLRETQDEATAYRHALRDVSSVAMTPADEFRELEDTARSVAEERHASVQSALDVARADSELWSSLDRARTDALLFHASVLSKEAHDIRSQLDQSTKQLAEAEAVRNQLSESLQRAQTEHAEAQRMLADSAASLAESNARVESFRKQLDVVKAEARADVARAEQGMQQEKQASQRLAKSLQQVKQAEQFLRCEVEQLSSDLAEAEKYEEAYNGLLAEVEQLVMKNALAEDEAQRLSKFNAEILGHNNPAQRIVYVDRIRRELHETKHKLLLSTRDRDAAYADNDDLRAELDLYKSVAVPQDVKPRTTITRVARPGTATLESDVTGPGLASSQGSEQAQRLSAARSSASSRLPSLPELPTEGDMTLDEIM